MAHQVTAFRWVPTFAQGYVRDLRVRWALEEAQLPYEAVLINFDTLASADYRRQQPFGQVPVYQDDDVEMFESGAIVLHIAGKSEALAPKDTAGRARVTTWVLAALNSIEPHAQNFIHFDGTDGGDWAEKHRSQLQNMLNERLAALSVWLGGNEYLEQRFTAGDLIMTTVLRELVDSGVLARYPNLDAYRQHCEARPAFRRAMDAQMQPFLDNAPA